jgi:transcriptional regulator with XRE-family HTH domain
MRQCGTMPDGELIGERIKRERLDRGWTQRQLADAVDVGVPHISKVEANRESPSDDLLERIAKVFKMDSAELFVAARRLPDAMMEQLALDPSRAVSFLRSYPKKRR